MSVTVPTTSSIKMRFPEFANVDDAVIEFAIEEARTEFGDGENWTTGASIGLLYLSAHFVSCSLARSASGGVGGDSQIKSESFGRFSVTYADTSNPAATPDDKDSTSYGRRYLELVSGNFSGAQII